MRNIVNFPNPDEISVTPRNPGSRLFFVQETRVFAVEAFDEQDALNIFTGLPRDEQDALEIEDSQTQVIASEN